jgi:hypothetical protein
MKKIAEMLYPNKPSKRKEKIICESSTQLHKKRMKEKRKRGK